MKREQFFFIGTEAELIKVFPVIIKCQEKGNKCHIIASGQNDLKKNRILDYIKLNGKFIELSREEDIVKNAKGLLLWFIKTINSAKKEIAKFFSLQEMKEANMIVHGDTVSTFMGALIGKQLHMKVCHVEAGLRSHHLFNPFPEEIDRMLTSRLAYFHFAPGEEAVRNLCKAKGKIINTKYNTILDSLMISQEMPIITEKMYEVLQEDYFVFVMHRQENLMNKDFVNQVVNQIIKIAEQKKCVLILHKITENTLIEIDRLNELQDNLNFILFARVDYFDFMKLLNRAKFVITDGGSNQEELHYMGKPCLIMRKTTERNEGIGQNARMFHGNLNEITDFAGQYSNYQIERTSVVESPADIIAKVLCQNNIL